MAQVDAIRQIGDGYFWRIDAQNMATLCHESGDPCFVETKGRFCMCRRERPGQRNLLFPIHGCTIALPTMIDVTPEREYPKDEGAG